MILFFFSYVLHYPPVTKLGDGNVFTPVCHSVHSGVGFPACITAHMTSIQGVYIQGSAYMEG